MKRISLLISLFFGIVSVVYAGDDFDDTNQASSPSSDQKPAHYGDWDVFYDKVLKTTTLIHQHRPYGQSVPGMGDAFTLSVFALEYSFQSVFNQKSGKSKILNYLVFDNVLAGSDASPGAEALKGLFKYSTNTQFTLLIDDQSLTFPVQNYHIGVYGDAIIGRHPYEEFRIPITQDILDKLVAAKEVDGNLSSDDQNASKSFMFDRTFKDIVKAFIYRVNEISQSASGHN